MGRIIGKDKTEGWQYLKALLDFAIAEGVKIVNATVNDTGQKAFKELDINGAYQEIAGWRGQLGVTRKV